MSTDPTAAALWHLARGDADPAGKGRHAHPPGTPCRSRLEVAIESLALLAEGAPILARCDGPGGAFVQRHLPATRERVRRARRFNRALAVVMVELEAQLRDFDLAVAAHSPGSDDDLVGRLLWRGNGAAAGAAD